MGLATPNPYGTGLVLPSPAYFSQLFPQNENCAKSPRFAVFGAMGEEQIGAARGAEAGLLDLRHPCAGEVVFVGKRKVKMGAMGVGLGDE